MSADNIVISFGDNILRESDVELLRGPYWLNDNVISFYFEYLSQTIYKNDKNILFVTPEVTHCLKAAGQEELSIFLDPLDAKNKSLVFFAFNNNKVYEESGGTHWSLLVFCRNEGSIFHVDSMSGTNFKQAAKMSGKLFKYLSADGTGDYHELDCLQQDNSYDCGIFVMCHTTFIAEYWKKHGTIANCEHIPRSVIKVKRKGILELIEKLLQANQI